MGSMILRVGWSSGHFRNLMSWESVRWILMHCFLLKWTEFALKLAIDLLESWQEYWTPDVKTKETESHSFQNLFRWSWTTLWYLISHMTRVSFYLSSPKCTSVVHIILCSELPTQHKSVVNAKCRWMEVRGRVVRKFSPRIPGSSPGCTQSLLWLHLVYQRPSGVDCLWLMNLGIIQKV
jgi:hypothetical protein